MVLLYMVTFTINIPQISPVMLAYIPAPWILWELWIWYDCYDLMHHFLHHSLLFHIRFTKSVSISSKMHIVRFFTSWGRIRMRSCWSLQMFLAMWKHLQGATHSLLRVVEGLLKRLGSATGWTYSDSVHRSKNCKACPTKLVRSDPWSRAQWLHV